VPSKRTRGTIVKPIIEAPSFSSRPGRMNFSLDASRTGFHHE
jgi:hypothetical protein